MSMYFERLESYLFEHLELYHLELDIFEHLRLYLSKHLGSCFFEHSNRTSPETSNGTKHLRIGSNRAHLSEHAIASNACFYRYDMNNPNDSNTSLL